MRGILRVLATILPLAASAAATAQGEVSVDALAAYDAGDYAEAARLWRQRAAAGDATAMVALAGLYEAGFGVPVDPERALALYRAAAAVGDPTARRILARRLHDGR